MRDIRLFNDGWEFRKSGIDDELAPADADGWSLVEIPHDWPIHDVEKLYEDGIGWYRKIFDASPPGEGGSVALRFEGVYMDSTVYVNGQRAGEWKHGYTSFRIDVSGFLRPGRNELLVKVVYRCPNSRWYSGAGIYRNVWLERADSDRIAADGIYVSTGKEAAGSWRVDVSAELALGSSNGARGCVLRHTVLDPQGEAVAVSEGPVLPGPAPEERCLRIQDPRLWDIERPALYSLVSELERDGKAVDRETTAFGFRTVEFDSQRGLFLNGRHIKIRGVCQHHDLGCLGAAVNKAAIRRQLSLLKEMGANAIRTAHNPPAVEFMELADEMGFLVASECFDMWEEPKNPFDYARFFPEWAGRDVAAWVRRDRNHPSLIMWCFGNEIHDAHAGERGLELTKELLAMVRSHDPRGNARPTLSSNYMPWEGAQKCADAVKLAGYNYGVQHYAKHHREHPDWIIYGSETGAIVQSRGVYHFPASKSLLADDDLQCSSLGNSSTSWGAKNIEACIADDRDAEFSLGQFIWSGFDYLGEPTPYHAKNSYFGQLDTCGFPKDSYYVYRAQWTNYRKSPMVHLFPYWDFSDGQRIDLRVCSNAPSVELFLDGESLGKTAIDHTVGRKFLADYSAPYRPGTLRAVAYDDSGRIIAEDVRASFGDAVGIALKSDKPELAADGRDLAFIEITAFDSAGLPVENANNRVQVRVSGAGRLIGLDNGDSADYDQYKGTSRRLFSGKLLAVVAARLDPGEIRVEVSSRGLKPAVLALEALPCERPVGVSAFMENPESAPRDELPVRKISLRSPSGTVIGKGNSRFSVFAEISPADADYRDLEWRATDDSGIDSIIARVEPRGSEATVTVIADGTFRVRCSSRNGADGIRLISVLDFTARGLGKAFLDPYGFVSGGLYDASNIELGNGNERGVATSRDAESHVGFRNVDFGSFGSDEVTVPIFELDNRPLLFRIWEGMPGEKGSEMLADAVYHKKSVWNVYQEQTFKLSRRIRGVATVCFVTDHKAHIKGFSFSKPRKAFSRLLAADNDRIYGDSFEASGGAIERIGNNVTLEFDGMDFGEEGASRIRVCGRSHAAKNTIHLRFEGEGGAESVQIAEFPRCDDYIEMEFELERVRGARRVRFVFLPGSSFDFKWFEFSTSSSPPPA